MLKVFLLTNKNAGFKKHNAVRVMSSQRQYHNNKVDLNLNPFRVHSETP